MEIRQFHHFVCVAENLNISKAARILSITQPALSRSIRALEAEFGMELIRRSRDGLELTEAGRVFLIRAREFMALEQDIRREMGELVREQSDIRVIVRCIETLIPDLLEQFRARYPAVCFSILQNDDIALQNHQYDLIISGELADETGLVRTRLLSERCLCAVPRSYAGERERITREEFRALPRSQFGGHRQIQRLIGEQLQRRGLARAPRTVCDDVQMGCRLAATGGCLIVPEYAVDAGMLEKVRLTEIEGVDIVRDIYLYRRANLHLSEPVQRFSRFVTAYFQHREQKGTAEEP